MNIQINENITINYNVSQEDINKYNLLLQLYGNNIINKFNATQQYIGDELFLKCKECKHIICLSEKRLKSKSKKSLCYKCESTATRRLNIIDYSLKAFEFNCRFIGNIENNNLIYGKSPISALANTGYYQCLLCLSCFIGSASKFEGCSSCNSILRRENDPNYGKMKTMEDYIILPIIMNKDGNYLGLLQNDGTYKPGSIPENTDSKLACFECNICLRRWNTSYHNIRNGDWCSKCSGKLEKTLEDYVNLPSLMNRNGKYLGLLQNDGNYNSGLIPENIQLNVAWFECNVCLRKWKTCYLTIKQGSWCSKCSEKLEKTLADYVNLPSLMNRNGRYLGLLQNDGSHNPTLIPKTSHSNIAWFECNVCLYKWKTSYHSINSGSWCSKCSGKLEKTLEDYINLPLSINRNGEYLGIIENGIIIRNKIPEGGVMSNLSIWYCNSCGKNWNATFHNIRRGSWCPYCNLLRIESKGAERCRLFLCGIGVEFQQEISLKGLSSRRYDFAFIYNGKSYIIEFDGSAHFQKKDVWHKSDADYNEKQYVDKIKTILPLLHGVNILRISNDSELNIANSIINFLNFKSDYPFIMFDNFLMYHDINACIITIDIINYFFDKDCTNKIITMIRNLKYSTFDLSSNHQCINFTI